MPCCFMFSVVLSIAGHRDCSDLLPAALCLLSSHTLFETGSHVAKTVFDLLCSQCLSLSNAGITGLHQSAQLSSPTSVLRRHCPTAALSPLDSHSLEHLLNILSLGLYSTVPTILFAVCVCVCVVGRQYAVSTDTVIPIVLRSLSESVGHLHSIALFLPCQPAPNNDTDYY